MVFAWRWSRSCLLAGCEECRRGADDHGRPSAGQGKFHGPRVHCGRSTLAAPLAHGQSLSCAAQLWVLLTYRWPAIPSSRIPTTTHQLAAHGLFALGLWLASNT